MVEGSMTVQRRKFRATVVMLGGVRARDHLGDVKRGESTALGN